MPLIATIDAEAAAKLLGYAHCVFQKPDTEKGRALVDDGKVYVLFTWTRGHQHVGRDGEVRLYVTCSFAVTASPSLVWHKTDVVELGNDLAAAAQERYSLERKPKVSASECGLNIAWVMPWETGE